jgi:hypothetical protein
MKSMLSHIVIFSLALLMALSVRLLGQTATLSLPTIMACPDTEVNIPIFAEHLYDVGAVSLFIGYDTTVLTYLGHENVHPQFTGMLSNAMTQPEPQIGLSWSNLSPANLPSGIMIELVFIYKENSCTLAFNAGGEIVNSDLDPILYEGVNGDIEPGPPYITLEPESVTSEAGQTVVFTIEAQQADTYQWQANYNNGWFDLANNDIYQNVNSSTLSISNVSLDMDNNWYRCFLTADEGCEIYSDSAKLSVLPLQSVQLSLPYLSACYDDVLAVPLQTVGMQNIVEFEINIAYDPEVATFNGLDNVNPLIQDITYTIHSSPVHHVSISWASAVPVSLTDGMVFEMLMQYATGTTSLDFLSSSLVMGEEGIGYDLFFQNGEIDAYPHPHIVSQPVAQTVYENGNAEFSVQAQNANGYQWYTFNNGNWEPLMDGGNYSGAETPNLLISEVSPNFNQKLYKCYVSGTFCSLFSEEAMLTVLPMPEAGLSLPDTLACPESVISIPLQAEGLDEITAFGILISFDPDVATFVQLDNLHPLIATTSATVHNEPVPHVLLSWSGEQSISLPDGNILNLVFEFGEGSSPLSFLSDSFVLNADQMAFDLTLNDGEINTQLHPVITSQPQNKTVSVGGLAQFQVQASNAISYQWLESQDNGDTWQNLSDTGPYGGSQTSVLTISPVDMGLDQNQYKCLVYGDWCEAETASVTLTVLPEMSAFLMLPDTASCLDEQINLPLYGAGLDQVLSFEIYLTFESDVVEFIEIIDIHPLLEGIEASLQTSPETQLLLSWEGNEPVSLPDGDIFKLQFVYAEGATALTFMDQTMILNEALSPFVLTTLDGQISSHEYPEIVAQPQNQITYIGASAQFEVQADNALTYQWFVSDDMGNSWDTVEEGINYSGSQSATLSILNANLSMDQTMYRCFVSAAFCGLYTNVAGLTVLPEIYAELTIDHVSACPGESVNIPIKGEGLYDVSEFGIFIAYDPMVAEFVEIVNPHPLIGDLEFVIQGQPNPQIIITWSGDATVELPDGDLFELHFNYADGEMALDLLEESYALSEELLPYNFLLFNGSLTPFPVPTIVAQPQDVIVEEGGEAVFSISAEDVLHFQWFESRDNGGSWLEVADNDMYAGSQTEVLTIVPVELSFDQYQYKCLLMGEFCDLYSSEAKLTVDTLTFIIERQLDQSARPDLLAASLYGNTLSLNFADPFTGRLHYRLFDLIGRILCENEYEVFNQTEIRIDMNHCQLKNQIYLLQGILMDSNGMHHAISSKILNTGY